MLGSMGLASSIGVGLAAGGTRPVVVLDGDGSVLMNLGTLATIAVERPARLTLVVLDNHVYGSTGSQPTATARGVDLAAMARAAGILSVHEVSAEPELEARLGDCLRTPGPHVILAHVEAGEMEVQVIPLAPDEIRARFSGEARTPPGVPAAPRPAGPSRADELAFGMVRAGADLACSVPCSSLMPLLEALVRLGVPHLGVTREEEGVGVCAGAQLAGRTPVLLMQNTGLGNSLNALATLPVLYRMPLVMLMEHRGLPGERISAQLPMGEQAPGYLETAGIPAFTVSRPEELDLIPRLVGHARLAQRPVAALVAPGAWR